MSKVYVNNKKYPSVNELEVAVAKEWHNISESELNHLVTSMKSRVLEVLSKNGGPILT